MQMEYSPDLLVDDSPAARRTSIALALVAAAALFGNCLLTSPREFSKAHQEDTSLLKPVVAALGLDGVFPTARGVEIRNLFFYVGAACLSLIAAIRLASTDRRPRATGDDLLDFRRRAASPYFWWLILLLVSVISSTFSHAPDICKGQSIIRFLHLAWWWPLAALLAPRHVGKLAGTLLAALGLTATVGLWYFWKRNLPGSSLSYPLGNELWLAACLLPGVFIAVGLFVGTGRSLLPAESGESAASTAAGHPAAPASLRRVPWLKLVLLIIAFGVIALALRYTGSRSALGGLVAGVFAVLCFATNKAIRKICLLTALVLAIAGMQGLRNQGASGAQGHSVRVRLNYAWPYALTLFFNKPVAGNGDGSYALLAGQFARDDQIEDPRTISFDEFSWFGRPDNEYLQLLSELGVVGMLAFVLALALTIHRALRFCDRTRGDPAVFSQRWLVIGLTAALIAMAVEEGGSPALREPGLPPIFLTVWAVLWALVRGQQQLPVPVTEDKQLGNAALRLSGVAAGICAVILGYFGIRDWQGARAYLDGERSLVAQYFQTGTQFADFAADYRLDPLQKLLARRQAVLARSLIFDQALRATEEPPTDRDVVVANEALSRLSLLDRAAPRFLGSARFAADLHWNLAQAYHRRGQSDRERERLLLAAQALKQHRADEPFNPAVVQSLWSVLRKVVESWPELGGRPEELRELAKDTQVIHRLDWLRCLLRAGEAPPGFAPLFLDLQGPRDEFNAVMQYLLDLAVPAMEAPSPRWADRLAPETFRLAALSTELSGYPADAAKLTESAVRLYEKAGPRLFAAHAAALNEWSRYDFEASPTANIEENLERLAEAERIMGGMASKETPLPGSLGQMRLRVLLAAGREKEAQTQLDHLTAAQEPSAAQEPPAAQEPSALAEGLPPTSAPRPSPSIRNRLLAAACFDVARPFAGEPASTNEALSWANRAAELSPEAPNVHGLLVDLYLRKGDSERALREATTLIEIVPPAARDGVYSYFSDLETRYQGNPLWTAMRERYPGFPPPPLVGPPEPEPVGEVSESGEARPEAATTAPSTDTAD